MQPSLLVSPANSEAEQDATAFYRHVLERLNDRSVPYLVGGAYALRFYTGISRQTKDLDLFIRREDYERVVAALAESGYATELTFPHWLAKVNFGKEFIDLIFSSGNGIATVDDIWFEHAIDAEVLGVPAKICPAEESIWSKAFIMERERYDGADIAHMVRAVANQLDWQRLLDRFAPCWRVLLSHLILFGFVYPAHRDLVPAWVMDDLLERLRNEMNTPPPGRDLCFGTLLSREQYLVDIEQWGYRDARLVPFGNMTEGDTASWTEAIQGKNDTP